MADAGMQRISIAARLPALGHETRIDRDSQEIVSRWNFGLSVAFIEDEVLLARQMKPVFGSMSS